MSLNLFISLRYFSVAPLTILRALLDLTTSRHCEDLLPRVFCWVDLKQEVIVSECSSVIIDFDDANC